MCERWLSCISGKFLVHQGSRENTHSFGRHCGCQRWLLACLASRAAQVSLRWNLLYMCRWCRDFGFWFWSYWWLVRWGLWPGLPPRTFLGFQTQHLHLPYDASFLLMSTGPGAIPGSVLRAALLPVQVKESYNLQVIKSDKVTYLNKSMVSSDL